jgi:hypothetical protein
LTSLAVAIDVPYGSDTLPDLADRADIVVEVKPGQLKPGGAADGGILSLQFVGKAGQLLKQEGDAPAEFPIVMRVTDDVASSEQFLQGLSQSGGVLFLRSTESQPELKGVAKYSVVGGRAGWVPLNVTASPETADAIKEYLELDDGARADWVLEHFQSSVPFVQKSAVIEAAGIRNLDERLQVLQRVLESSEVRAANKALAVDACAATGDSRAVGPLSNVARQENAPDFLRSAAIRSLSGLDEGEAALKEFADSPDPFLKERAKQALDNLKSQDSAGNTSILLDSISGPLVGVVSRLNLVRQAAEQVQTPVDADMIKEFIDKAPRGQSESLHLAAIEGLGAANTPDAARLLEKMALDQSQSELVRSSAILGISQIDSGISLSALKRVAEGLEATEGAKPLRELVAGLRVE